VLKIIPVSTMDEVLAKALVRQPEPIEWTEVAPVAVAADDAEASDSMITH